MYGVVLWSDVDDQKAVIWCEDHGDLAFYSGKGDCAMDGPSLDAGDLVHFQITDGNQMRLASKPRLIAENQYPRIVEQLRGPGKSVPKSASDDRRRSQGNVLAFKKKEEFPACSVA